MSPDPHDRPTALLRPPSPTSSPPSSRRPELCAADPPALGLLGGQIGRWLDRPAAIIPARWTSVQIPVGQLHHARIGVTAKIWRTTNPICARRCAGSLSSTIFRGTGCGSRRTGRHSATGLTTAASAGSGLKPITLLLGPPHRARLSERQDPRGVLALPHPDHRTGVEQ